MKIIAVAKTDTFDTFENGCVIYFGTIWNLDRITCVGTNCGKLLVYQDKVLRLQVLDLGHIGILYVLEKRLLVVSVEGQCHVFETMDGGYYSLSLPYNTNTFAKVNNTIYIGTRDRRIHVYEVQNEKPLMWKEVVRKDVLGEVEDCTVSEYGALFGLHHGMLVFTDKSLVSLVVKLEENRKIAYVLPYGANGYIVGYLNGSVCMYKNDVLYKRIELNGILVFLGWMDDVLVGVTWRGHVHLWTPEDYVQFTIPSPIQCCVLSKVDHTTLVALDRYGTIMYYAELSKRLPSYKTRFNRTALLLDMLPDHIEKQHDTLHKLLHLRI